MGTAKNKAIVIGTGAGGLTAAVGLAQAGYEVTALEREKQLGGFLNPFKRRHYHFDPGVHYVGQCHPGGDIFRVLRRCGIDSTELFAPMDDDGFDVLRFPGAEVKVPKGIERYRDHLIDLFPSERDDIHACFKTMQAFAAVMRSSSGAGQKLKGLPAVARLATMSYGAYLESTFREPKLRAILGAQCGDYGVPPSQAPALLGMGLIIHFVDGGSFFPRGGSGSLRDALVNAGRSLGVVYKKRSEVAHIHTSRGKVTGVSLASGEHFPCEVVVSAVDPTLTYGKFIEGGAVPRRLRKKVERNLPSVGSLCLYYGMERDLRDHGLGAFNVWDYPTWDVESAFKHALDQGDVRRPSVRSDGTVDDDYAFFLSPNSLKDDTGQMAPKGCSTLEVVTLSPFEPFAQWADQKALKRGGEYDVFKRECADRLRASVERRWPGIIGDVVVEDVSTPVTNVHFAGAVQGGIYGPAPTREQFGLNAYRTASPIDGLFIAGAGVLGPGVAPCLGSGIKAAKAAAKSRTSRFGWLPSRKSKPSMA